jgi:hypothetical protein
MVRRLVVEYTEEGIPPKIELEGSWNRRNVDQLTNALYRALRIHKAELMKKLEREKQEKINGEDTIKAFIKEKSDGKRK